MSGLQMQQDTAPPAFQRELGYLRLADRLLLRAVDRANRLSILIYHRVLPAPDPMCPGEIDARTFHWQLDLLAEHFRVLPLSEAVERLAAGCLPPRAACITFDDGYADNARVALPILREKGLPATFFVASGFLDGGQMWNDMVFEALRRLSGETLDVADLGLGCHAIASVEARISAAMALVDRLKYLPHGERLDRARELARRAGLAQRCELMMRSEEVRELAAAGMEVGGHTVNHPILAVLDPAAARREIADNRDALSALIGAPVRLFAYPNGKPGQDYLPEHVEMVRDLGYRAAVSTRWGVCTTASHRWQLPRFTPWDATPARFLARLLQSRWRPA